MPEMPDVTVYAERLARRVVGKRLQRIKVLNPFLVRTAVPPLATAEGRQVEGV
jgi:formamidopyrimidine-DNA glycosylase